MIQGQKGTATHARLPKRARSTARFVSFYFSNLPQQELGYYAQAYLEAARTLLRSLRRRGGFSKIVAAPILFMYRHAIELYLKSIVIVGNRSLTASPADDEKLFKSLEGHKLLPLLPRVEAVFNLVGWEWRWPLNPLVETKADVERLLAHLEDIDPTLRYPVDKRGRRSIATDVWFNLESVVAALDALAEALDTADAGLKTEFGL